MSSCATVKDSKPSKETPASSATVRPAVKHQLALRVPTAMVKSTLEKRMFSLDGEEIVTARHLVDKMTERGGIYRYHQFVTPFLMNQVTVADNFFYGTSNNSLAPYLNLLDQAGTFTALFDQWRIVEMVVHIHPSNRVGSPLQYTQTLPPAVYFIVDNDDAASPGTLSAMREYQTCKLLDPYQPHTIHVRPRIAAALYNGASTGYGLAPVGTWIDCSNSSVPYYGVKLGVSGGNSGQTELWNAWVHVQLVFELRHVR